MNSNFNMAGYIVIAIPMLIALLAIVTGMMGFARAKRHSTGRGKVASILGMSFGLVSETIWVIIVALTLL